MEHGIFIAQNLGGIAKRVFHYIKPERVKWFRVRIKNLITQSSWDYDKYHMGIEDGKYVLIFTCDENGTVKHLEIEVKPNDGNIYIVFSWEEFTGIFTSNRISESEFEEMEKAKRLAFPSGFQGY